MEVAGLLRLDLAAVKEVGRPGVGTSCSFVCVFSGGDLTCQLITGIETL